MSVETLETGTVTTPTRGAKRTSLKTLNHLLFLRSAALNSTESVESNERIKLKNEYNLF